jgi:membrane-associated protein
MEILYSFLDIFIHLDKHLGGIIQSYGTFTYAILFLVVFCETGLVVTPFLPGDSLLFAAGAFAAQGSLDIQTVLIIFMVAPLCGDNVNYWIGHFLGPKVFRGEGVRFLNRKHLERTHAFYERHGGKTIIIARFMPIIRTFAPFVAGIGRMKYWKFLAYSVAGAVLWNLAFVVGGYFFGNIPFVKENFTAVIFAIIIISVSPGAIGYLRHRFKERSQAAGDHAEWPKSVDTPQKHV